jgi:putative transposase
MKLCPLGVTADASFEVHERDDSDHAVELLRRTALAEGLHAMTQKPVLLGDNGSTLKATTVMAMMYWLGLKASYSRPRVSDDNVFSGREGSQGLSRSY